MEHITNIIGGKRNIITKGKRNNSIEGKKIILREEK